MQGHANTIEPYSYLYYYIELVKLMKTYRRNYREDGMHICRQVLKAFADREQKKAEDLPPLFLAYYWNY